MSEAPPVTLYFPVSASRPQGEPSRRGLGLRAVSVAGACPTHPQAGATKERPPALFPPTPMRWLASGLEPRMEPVGAPADLVSSSSEASGKQFNRPQGKPSLRASLRGPGPTLLRVTAGWLCGKPRCPRTVCPDCSPRDRTWALWWCLPADPLSTASLPNALPAGSCWWQLPLKCFIIMFF